jgi:hypothetical protein
MKSTILCSPLRANRRFGGTCCRHLRDQRISRSRKQCERRWQANLGEMFLRNVSSRSSKTTRRYIPENSALHNRQGANLKSYIHDICRRFHHKASEIRSRANHFNVLFHIISTFSSHLNENTLPPLHLAVG